MDKNKFHHFADKCRSTRPPTKQKFETIPSHSLYLLFLFLDLFDWIFFKVFLIIITSSFCFNEKKIFRIICIYKYQKKILYFLWVHYILSQAVTSFSRRSQFIFVELKELFRNYFPVLSRCKHSSKCLMAVSTSSYWRALDANLHAFCARWMTVGDTLRWLDLVSSSPYEAAGRGFVLVGLTGDCGLLNGLLGAAGKSSRFWNVFDGALLESFEKLVKLALNGSSAFFYRQQQTRIKKIISNFIYSEFFNLDYNRREVLEQAFRPSESIYSSTWLCALRIVFWL